MFRSFDPDVTGLALGDPRLDVPDPYYGTETDFASVLRLVEAASDGLVRELPGMLAQRSNGRG
jgi:protein-tyrosine phosphatase